MTNHYFQSHLPATLSFKQTTEHGQTIHISNISPKILTTHSEPRIRGHAFFLRKDCLLLVRIKWTVSPARSPARKGHCFVQESGHRQQVRMDTIRIWRCREQVVLLQGTKPTKGAGDALPFSLLFRFHDVSSRVFISLRTRGQHNKVETDIIMPQSDRYRELQCIYS